MRATRCLTTAFFLQIVQYGATWAVFNEKINEKLNENEINAERMAQEIDRKKVNEGDRRMHLKRNTMDKSISHHSCIIWSIWTTRKKCVLIFVGTVQNYTHRTVNRNRFYMGNKWLFFLFASYYFIFEIRQNFNGQSKKNNTFNIFHMVQRECKNVYSNWK